MLCDHTAIVGVMKQTNKATGELQESEIKFGKEALPDEDGPAGGAGGLAALIAAQQKMMAQGGGFGFDIDYDEEEELGGGGGAEEEPMFS